MLPLDSRIRLTRRIAVASLILAVLCSLLVIAHAARSGYFLDYNASSLSPSKEGKQQEQDNTASRAVELSSAFDSWTKEYLAAANPESFLSRGRELAAKRRRLLKDLILTDPARALALAVSRETTREVPSEIRENLEEQISAYGDYFVVISDEIDPVSGAFVRTRTDRMVVIQGKLYEAKVYGRMLNMTSKRNIPLNGIAIDGVMVINESPVRILSPPELADLLVRGKLVKGGVAVDIGGEIRYFKNEQALSAFIQTLVSREMKIGPDIEKDKEELSFESNAPLTADSAWTEGPKSVLFIRVDFSNLSGEPVSTSSAQSVVNVDANNFYRDNSYDKTSLQATVTPVLRMPQSADFYTSQSDPAGWYKMMSDAEAVAKASGFDPANYNLDIVGTKSMSFPKGFSGRGNVGSRGSHLNGSFGSKVTEHELGHNYGLWHANFWQTTDGSSIGPGSSIEYGDPFDVMGNGFSSTDQFNNSNKYVLNWLTPSDIQTITTSGTYRLQAYDFRTATGIRGLRIVKDSTTYYWIEFRQASTSNTYLMNGALIRWGRDSGSPGSDLLDMTPGSSLGSQDAPLAIGKTFSDSALGISITAVQKVGTALDVNVSVSGSYTIGQNAPNPQLFKDAANRGAFLQYAKQPPTSAVYRWNCTTCDPNNTTWGKGLIQDFDDVTPGVHDALMLADTNTNFVAQIYGAMWDKLNQLGGLNYNSTNTRMIGYPIADRNCSDYNATCFAQSALHSPFGTNYDYQRFQGGAFVLHRSGAKNTQTFEIHGAIRARWQALNGPDGSYGLPISDEYASSGKRRSDFEGGSICYNPATGQTEDGCATVTPPSAPTANAATNVTSSSFTANWSNSSGATGYRLDVSFSSSFSSYVSGYQNLDVGNVSSRSVTGLTAGINYYYRVRAYNSAGTSANSGTISLTTTLTNYAITLNVSPSGSGTVSGAGTFAAGSSRTVTATANSGFTFTNWTESGSVVSSSASYTFTLNSNRTLVANFTAVNYVITLNVSPSGSGTVSGSGTYAAGSSRTVTASANNGYSFTNWTENGSAVSSSASYTFTLNSNRTLVANFTVVNYVITLNVSPNGSGTVSGSGTFAAGSSRTVTASANNGYSFTNWTENGSAVSSSTSYTFTLNSNRTLVANFTVVNYVITLNVSPNGSGTVSGSGTFAAGSSRTVTASANNGYSFTNWTENGSAVSSSTSYTFTLNSNRTLVANFTAVNYVITLNVSPNGSGTVSGSGTYAAGSSRTVTATANSGYTFTNWTESGSVVSSSASYTFTLNSNRTLVANFTPVSSGNASYDATLKAPKCAVPGSVCDSGTLLNGRDTITGGQEPNQPNTIFNSCADNTVGSYHVDESIDRIKVSTLDGSNLGSGKTVRIEVTVWAFSVTDDFLDLFYTADATNPNWTYITTLVPSISGAQVLSTTFTLPAGGTLQAVRANFLYQGGASPCSGGSGNYDDHDDLVFATSGLTSIMQLVLEEFGPSPGQAAALDSMSLLRDPFPVVNLFNLGTDRNTRVIIFATNLQLAPGETALSVIVNLVDSNSQSYDVAAEDVRSVPNSNFTQVIFRLPNNLAVGTCIIKVKAHGQVSNAGTIRIRL